MKKNIVITIDNRIFNEKWQVDAAMNMFSDFVEKNEILNNNYDIIIIPHHGKFNIYLLDGNVDNKDDINELKDIENMITPVLQKTIDIQIPELAKKTIKKLEKLNNEFKSNVQKTIKFKQNQNKPKK